jgi:hypothetical protein
VSFVSSTVFVVATWLAAICGAVSIMSALVSAIVGYQLSENASREANIKIAESSARQKEAELKLAELREKLGRPRKFDQPSFAAALEGISKIPVQISLLTENDAESFWLASNIFGALDKSKWPVSSPPSTINPIGETPLLLRPCAGNFGIIVVLSKSMSDEEAKFLASNPRPERPNTPFLAMWDALWKAVGENEVGFATCPMMPDGQLHIVVQPRWVILPADAGAAVASPTPTK